MNNFGVRKSNLALSLNVISSGRSLVNGQSDRNKFSGVQASHKGNVLIK
jgi:hypothetical protein